MTARSSRFGQLVEMCVGHDRAVASGMPEFSSNVANECRNPFTAVGMRPVRCTD